ncbi:MAG: tRNA (adenosine(37)-N6)-dimethylallyltransferase MiaA [Candidatus Aquirickettsiella gammari]|uniref:tRNA dimethylallyltransferase n=1 Tax=Candidatus Aquirickettsiella gammari TaxID=2016198 RepID=A0A370CHF2_9COXI|nr:MAG: tRNA (adenosine(37)-N6)-dimethylallyltransferase MiaA [Candidatus Aquirickettsiella gammari]
MDAKPVICLMGPTASGKTNLAIELIQHLDAEIISVDSAMIYRSMDIGTAKPSPLILKQAPHRLIDTHDASQSYSAGEFRVDAISAIEEILARDHIPLLVGGTMLYFHVLQQGIATLPPANQLVRQQLKKELEQQGLKKLHQRLTIIDPIAAQRIHPNDPQRLLRALEVPLITGKTLTALQQAPINSHLPYLFINIALIPSDRNLLRQSIATRFQTMLKLGLLEEVEQLFKRGDLHANLPSMRTVGYRQVWNYLMGHISAIEMQESAIIATRQLAKRQLTWLRSWKKLNTLLCHDKENIQKIIQLINK